MNLNTVCRHCHQASVWPPDLVGKEVRCPECLKTFPARPILLAKKVDQESLLEVVAVDQPTQGGAMVGGKLLTPAVEHYRKDSRQEPFLLPQRTVYALLMWTLDQERRAGKWLVGWILLSPLLIPLWIGLAFGLMQMVSLVRAGLSLVLGDGANAVLYLIPVLFFVFVWGWKQLPSQQTIELKIDHEGRIGGFVLGKLHAILQPWSILSLVAFMSYLFGLQVGLLYFTTDHLGLPISGGLAQCLRVSFTNLTRTGNLDVDSFQEFGLTEDVELPLFTAVVFFAFRLGYALLPVLGVYDLYQRYTVYKLVRDAPTRKRSIRNMAHWLALRCDDRRGWPRMFFDEFLFLLLVGEYLRGNFELVDYLSRRFSRLDVRSDVRSLFVDRAGIVLFQGKIDA